jgi:hypothetical protein
MGHGISCYRKFVLLYCAVGFENKKVFVANAKYLRSTIDKIHSNKALFDKQTNI